VDVLNSMFSFLSAIWTWIRASFARLSPRKRVHLAIGLLVATLFVPRARLELACATLWRCYQSPAFRFTVIDTETGQPVPDVHAIAEWGQYGFHGSGPPLVAFDAVSGADGFLAFPAWGPMLGSSGGLRHQEDPAITLFRPGYRTLTLWNHATPRDEHTRRRPVSHDGKTIPLEPFHGSRLGWYGQLRKAQRGGVASGRHLAKILQPDNPYVNRLRRILLEVSKLPRYRVSERTVSLDDYFRVEEDIKFFQEHAR
jgi:hypothetical protein